MRQSRSRLLCSLQLCVTQHRSLLLLRKTLGPRGFWPELKLYNIDLRLNSAFGLNAHRIEQRGVFVSRGSSGEGGEHRNGTIAPSHISALFWNLCS